MTTRVRVVAGVAAVLGGLASVPAGGATEAPPADLSEVERLTDCFGDPVAWGDHALRPGHQPVDPLVPWPDCGDTGTDEDIAIEGGGSSEWVIDCEIYIPDLLPAPPAFYS